MLWSWCVLLAVSACERSQSPRLHTGVTPPAHDIAIPLAPYLRDLRLVRLAAGTDTLSFLLDTGGGATVLTPQSAARLGCTPYGADVGHRMDGEVVVFARCDSLRLTVDAWSVRVAPVGVLDLSRLLPPDLPHLDGVLALDAFAGQVVTLDWTAGHVKVLAAARAESALRASGIPFRIGTGESGRFLQVLARVEGTRGPLWFLLDSGNLMGTRVATSVLRDSLLPLSHADSAVLRIGSRPAIAVVFHAADLVLDGALGTDYLRRGPVTLDLRR